MVGFQILKKFRSRVCDIEFAEQFDLTDFMRIPEAGIVVRKYVAAVSAGHIVQRLIAALGQNDSICLKNSRPIFGSRPASGADDVFIRFI